MSLTNDLRRLHKQNPDWGYKLLAKELKANEPTLRAINNRLKLPIPVRAKSPDGKRKIRVSAEFLYKKQMGKKPKPSVMAFHPAQVGSGRKTYFSYLKLL